MQRALGAVLLFCALLIVLQPPLWPSRTSPPTSSLNKGGGALLPVSTVCNVFEGEWVLDDDAHYPLYKPGACPFVEDSFSCFAHGRSDSTFTRWSWRPRACRIPRFDGRDMLEGFRGKRVVFVGDSLSRNQWESMLCLLSQALPNYSSVLEVNGLQITKDNGVFHVLLQDYNCHLEYYSSRFLVEEEYNTSRRSMQLRLDRIHTSHSHWSRADVLVFTTGHWWTHGKTDRGKHFYKEGNSVYPKLNLMLAFTKALQTWANWVDGNLNHKKTRVFLVGYSPGHFRGGKWNTGGECQRAIKPIVDISEIPKYPEKMLVIERTVHDMKFPVKLLNITGLSSYRIDGHPSIYGLKNAHGYQDCSHWCLPGIPDVWNVLLYALLIMDPKT